MKLTQARVKELFDYDPETGHLLYRKKRKGVTREVGEISGCLCARGYRYEGIDGKVFLTHRVVWLWHYGYLPEHHLDHINQNTLDNRIENLREVTRSCNLRNSKLRADNSTGVKGITALSGYHHTKYRVRISVGGVRIYLGDSYDFMEALAMRLAAEQCLDWRACDERSPTASYMRRYLESCE